MSRWSSAHKPRSSYPWLSAAMPLAPIPGAQVSDSSGLYASDPGTSGSTTSRSWVEQCTVFAKPSGDGVSCVTEKPSLDGSSTSGATGAEPSASANASSAPVAAPLEVDVERLSVLETSACATKGAPEPSSPPMPQPSKPSWLLQPAWEAAGHLPPHTRPHTHVMTDLNALLHEQWLAQVSGRSKWHT